MPNPNYTPQAGTKRFEVYRYFYTEKITDLNVIAEKTGFPVNKVKAYLEGIREQIEGVTRTPTESLVITRDEFTPDTTINTSSWAAPSLGADPELIISKDNRLVGANYVFGRSLKSRVGTDGCSSTMEIRPSPGADAFEVAKNVRRCLNTARKKLLLRNLSEAELYCGAGKYGSTTGGHIHFGCGFNDTLTKGLDMLSILTINLGNNTPEAIDRKMNSGYGHLGYNGGSGSAPRVQPWGFEYRTPISWLKNPELTTKILALYHLAVIEHLNNPTSFAALAALYKHTYSTKFNHSFCGEQEKLKNLQKRIINVIKTFNAYRANYKNYSQILVSFFDECLENKKLEMVVDEKAWRLTNVKPTPRVRNPVTQKLFKFSNDDVMSEIRDSVDNINAEQTGQISLVGLNETRDMQVSIGEGLVEEFGELITDYCDDPAREWRFTYSNQFGNRTIGFRRDLRVEKKMAIVTLLNLIKARARRLNGHEE